MTDPTAALAIVGVGVLACVFFTRIPLAIVLMGAGYLGFAALHPKGLAAAGVVASQQILDLALDFQFSVVPLFVAMGVFVARAGLSDDLYEAAYAWFGHLRGGLAMATIAACGAFAAITGSSAASAATMAKVAVPPMNRHRYDPGFAAGTVAAGGTMGILIPPSGALIVYGLLTEQDIAKLFIAGIGPGLLQIVAYLLVVTAVGFLMPGLAPRGERSSWRARFASLADVWGVIVLFVLVLGGLFFGLVTTTEAGGLGAVGALAFALLRRRMTWRIFIDSLMEAARTTAMIFAVAFGALILNQFVNLSGLSGRVVATIEAMHLSPMVVVVVILVFYVILGMFIDGFAMIFLTVPVFVPVIQELGFDLVWWGIVLVMMVEISLITPPIGLNVFVIKSTLPEVPIGAIFRGIVPYFMADIVRLAIVVLLPPIALLLPGLMG
jgi:C4-dicarboxylate transporter, DctM subunit